MLRPPVLIGVAAITVAAFVWGAVDTWDDGAGLIFVVGAAFLVVAGAVTLLRRRRPPTEPS
jgi:MYXO-CTERM domain-containing protein